jgi:hypothetical protein
MVIAATVVVGATASALVLAGWLVAGNTVAAGATTHSITVPVTTFVQVPGSTHNGPTAPFCGAQVSPVQGSERNGALVGGAGSYLAALSLPDQSTVTGLTFALLDNDANVDAAAFLLRKNISAGLTVFGNLVNVVHAQSSGASGLVRQFSSTSIHDGLIDNKSYTYYLEVVNCGATVDPIGVQVTYTTP